MKNLFGMTLATSLALGSTLAVATTVQNCYQIKGNWQNAPTYACDDVRHGGGSGADHKACKPK